jgi:hypothetical protein
MKLREQIGYTGTEPNDILKFKDWNPINRGTIDAMNNIGSVKSKDAYQTNKDILEDPEEDDGIETDEEDNELVINRKSDQSSAHYWSYPYGFPGAPMAVGRNIATDSRILAEAVGVPNDIEPWLDLLYSFIKNQIYIFVDTVSSSDDYNTEAELKGESFVGKSLIFNVEGNQFDPYIKNYIPKDNKLKMRQMQIELGLTSVPDHLFDFDNWHASFSDVDATVKKKTYLNTRFRFELTLPERLLKREGASQIDGFMRDHKIDRKIVEFLSHELTHAYEYYHRKLNQVDVWKDRLLNTNKYIVESQLLSNVSDEWKDFLNLIYLSLDFEINARITQLYYRLSESSPLIRNVR